MGSLGGHVHTALFKNEKPTRTYLIAQGTLLRFLLWQPELEGSLEKMDACVCVAESLSCSPATMTSWFVNWLYHDTK